MLASSKSVTCVDPSIRRPSYRSCNVLARASRWHLYVAICEGDVAIAALDYPSRRNKVLAAAPSSPAKAP
ncbi:hypothetical protein NPX13_g1158 [Xylaria arbuscula]|uniref:Uncharacterized protein n=1 Tax=Xylaria arbuscula TaxID=114810 RepID=A0A9W8NN16_9PEZI|nr:hypothetical protein NPX13_g1158 [Xylaria arbuscula]